MIVIPIYILIILMFGLIKRVNCFDVFLEGSKKGLISAYNLFPTIIGLVFSINVFTNSGIIEILEHIIHHPTIVPEIFIQSILRPLSANSSLIIMNDIYQIYSPNSLTGQISSLIQGCSDTTIYVITIYFSSVSIKKTHYTVYVGLLTDLITFVLAIILGLKFL